MKKIKIEVVIEFPESIAEAISKYGEEDVFKDYIAMKHISNLNKIRSALK